MSIHSLRVIRPVNQSMSRPVSRGASNSAEESRLYLRESDLDQGASLIRQSARKIRHMVGSVAQEAGLLEAELDTLIELVEMEGCDISELRAHLFAPKQSLARNLNALEKSGYIERVPCPKDGRRRLLNLTESGKEVISKAANGWRDVLLEAYRASGPEVVANAKKLLQHVAKSSPEKDEDS
ncbi:transcriptional regulator, MarR family [Hirschia baltica ATCC 49814]|uniref:Transcriptional regulator, MarR family n=2 Tax=Hirschia TaxID=2723 RepID=C6XM74_HIRBI|nr:transcriptional regulator, MarR family [Hirschia baltica ATCC 49814]